MLMKYLIEIDEKEVEEEIEEELLFRAGNNWFGNFEFFHLFFVLTCT